MTDTLATRLDAVIAEARLPLARMPADALAPLVAALDGANRVAVWGQGRTGMVMQALTMRLYHLGLDAHWVGLPTTPPIGPGGLFLVNAATGDLPTGLALAASAKAAGAGVAAITAVPEGPIAALADLILHLPGQTMASDANPSLLPMGSPYELALFLITEALVLDLAARRGISFTEMRARHANLL